MLSKFICNENDNQLEILDFLPPKQSDFVRCPALINNTQLVVMQMSSVDMMFNVDISSMNMMSLCTGSLETEILPLLTSNVFATEVCIMFYIEKMGQQIVYR